MREERFGGDGTTVDSKTEDDSALGGGEVGRPHEASLTTRQRKPIEVKNILWMETGRKRVWGENTQHPVVSFIPCGSCLVRA